jgi:hypothetical protein
MEGDELSRWRFLDNIDRDASMVIFVGHGGYDDNGPFLQISAGDRLRPRDLAQLRFDGSPVAHLECCIAGHAVYFGGGYWNSYPVSFLANGASCCLVSNRIVFGEASKLFCRELYGRLANNIPGTRRRVELTGARIFFPEERSLEFNQELRAHWQATQHET